jgi:L-threonylcarbamoyladenylate synthase
MAARSENGKRQELGTRDSGIVGKKSQCIERRGVKTLRLKVNVENLGTPEAQDGLERAAGILRGGGLVALPTETVYGLGANALDRAAVERIFEAKSRPAWDPVIVHVASQAMLDGLVEEVPEEALKLMEAFWPGPLTLLLKRTSAVPDAVTAGRPLVGVRMPAHPVALELIRRAGIPVAAPSANRFGHVSPTTAAHVLDDLDGRIDAVLDAGPTIRGVESTVLDAMARPMMIYRPGAVTAEQIAEIVGPVEIFRCGPITEIRETPAEGLPSPGVGIKHYAPRARLVLVEARDETRNGELGVLLAEAARGVSGERLGVMLPAGIAAAQEIAAAEIYAWGRWDEPETLARELYAGLRALDAAGCTVILCPLPPAEGIGAAIRDRLLKAGTEPPQRV